MKRKICNYPGCTTLIAMTERYCGEHKRENSTPFQNAVRTNAALYNTDRWKKLRSKIVKEHPYCSRCGISKKESRLEVHHIIAPRGSEELFFDEDNLVPVCESCHSVLTAQEINSRRNKHDA
jgi:5-methylcytosine-specific restriction endonuclease McrA